MVVPESSQVLVEMRYRCMVQGKGTDRLPRASLRGAVRLILEVRKKSGEWNRCPRQVKGSCSGKTNRNFYRQKERSESLLPPPAVRNPSNASDWQNLMRTPLVRGNCGLQSPSLSIRNRVKKNEFGAETQGLHLWLTDRVMCGSISRAGLLDLRHHRA